MKNMVEGPRGFFDKAKLGRPGFLSSEQVKSFQMVDITVPGERELQRLREHMREAEGKATLIIHPNYGLSPRSIQDVTPYREELRSLITSSRDRHIPLIAFEEEGNIPSLCEYFPEASEVFIIQTEQGDPTPATKKVKRYGAMDEYDDEYELYQPARDEAFHLLFSSLALAGVRDVIVGGRYLGIDPTTLPYKRDPFVRLTAHSHEMKMWAEQGLVPEGCVGKVIREALKVGIEVKVSEAVGPDRPSLFVDCHNLSL